MATDYVRLRQVCLVAPALRPIQVALESVFGLQLCYRDPHVGKYGLVNALFPVGTDFIEVVVPTRTETAAGRFLDKSGGRGAYMAIFDCARPDVRAEHAERRGARVAHVIDHAGFHGMQMHPKDCRAAMIEFDRTEGASDPMGAYYPAGGKGWTTSIRKESTLRMSHVLLESPTPDDLAGHWSNLIGLPLVDGVIRTDALDIRFDPEPRDGREALTTIGLQVSDIAATCARARHADLPVRGQRIALGGVWFDLQPVSP